jgi:phage regulator Rha-like protein
MTMRFDEIEKRLANHAKTAKAVAERAQALKEAKAQAEAIVQGRQPATLSQNPLPLIQNKR